MWLSQTSPWRTAAESRAVAGSGGAGSVAPAKAGPANLGRPADGRARSRFASSRAQVASLAGLPGRGVTRQEIRYCYFG